jgi:hypothetical protein
MIVVVTLLIHKSSLTALLVLNMAAFKHKVAPSIVDASAADCAQLTGRNGLVLVIIVINVGDAPCAPLGL